MSIHPVRVWFTRLYTPAQQSMIYFCLLLVVVMATVIIINDYHYYEFVVTLEELYRVSVGG